MRENKDMKTAILSFLLITVLTTSSFAAESRLGYILNFPDIALDKKNGERIEQIQITVSCGHIEAILSIPDDWNIDVIRAISAVEELHASAGHGASMLHNIKTFSGVIQLSVGESDCFKVSASLMTSGTDTARQIDFPQSKLELQPVLLKPTVIP